MPLTSPEIKHTFKKEQHHLKKWIMCPLNVSIHLKCVYFNKYFPWFFMICKDIEIERSQAISENFSAEMIVKGVILTLGHYWLHNNKITFPFRFPDRQGISRQPDWISLIPYLSSRLNSIFDMMGQDFLGNVMSEFKHLMKESSNRIWTK